MGIFADANTSGSGAFYDDTASAAGRQILRLGACGGFSGMHGPFISSCAISYGALENASAIVWIQDT
ncbi:hypothetical protein LCGC14_1373200 [marine sediment metagenome]|uniref:Uncharacterized protein n=1 Tax=marine sediment metagenome TaxID=412755 RepID=A0A0F9MK36_9ZZZZ